MGRPRVANPADRRVHTYVPADVSDAVDALAKVEGSSRAAILRRALIADLTRRSRAAQGLPEHVEDPAALARVAAILEDAS
jgi:predicted transcriptional regulator